LKSERRNLMEEEAKKEETQEAKPEDLKDLKERLERMTATELREMGLGIQGLAGVHAMKKEELLAAIKEAKGIKDEEPAKPKGSKSGGLKQQMASLRKEREEARAANNKAKMSVLKRRIHHLKKKTRKTA
jgi:hypothetical protein